MLEDTYLYNILGVQPGATLAELRKFYFLQAREVHPDRNHGDPTAGHKFQMLGEAFQVLSDPQQREAYDLYGRTAIRFEGLSDASVVYGMMFGSDAFEQYLGQSRVAAVAAFGGGEKPREAVLAKLRVAQREREAKLVRHLAERLGRFREGEQESHFASWAAEEARQLADAAFGEELLRRVGSAYERRSAAGVGSSSFLSSQHGGADWTRQAGDTVSSQVSAAAGGVQALAMQEDADDFEGDGRDLTEETLTTFFDSSRCASPEIMWKLHVADINATLASVCSQVLSDIKCDQETLRSRAKALKRLGSIFVATAAQSKRKEAASQGGPVAGASGMGSRVYTSGGGRFSEYSPPSTPTPSGFGAGNNPSLQGLHQGEGQGYAGMAHGGTSHEQFLSGEQLGAGSGDVGLPAQRGDGGDLALEGMGRGSRMYHTRYFIIKSLNHQNIASSIEKGCWATQAMNEPKLNEAYDTAENVVLIFSVNMSGHFQGYARMMSPIGRRRANIWNESNDGGAPWGGLFSVQWERLYDLPFQKTVHLKNPLNMFKPVKISRDCQELTAEIGEALCALIDDGADKEGRPKRKVIAGDYSTQDAGMKRPRGSEQMYFPSDPPFPGGAQAGSAHPMQMPPPSNTAMMYRNMPGRFMAGGAPPMGGYPPGGGGRMLPALHSPYSTPDLDYPGSRSRRQVSPASTASKADMVGEKSGGGGAEREPPRMKGREKLRLESDRHIMRERAVDLEDDLEGGAGWFGGGSRQEVKRTGGGRRTNGRGGLPPEEELLNMTYEEYLQRVGAGGSFAGYEGGARSGYSSASRQGAGYGADYGMTAGGGYGPTGTEGMYGGSMSYRAGRPTMGSGSEYGGSMGGYSPAAGSMASAGYDEGWGAGVGPEGYGTSLHQPHSGMFGGGHGSRNMGGRE